MGLLKSICNISNRHGASRAFAIFQIGMGLQEHLQYFK
jgi:hypothetical protein